MRLAFRVVSVLAVCLAPRVLSVWLLALALTVTSFFAAVRVYRESSTRGLWSLLAGEYVHAVRPCFAVRPDVGGGSVGRSRVPRRVQRSCVGRRQRLINQSAVELMVDTVAP